MGTNIEMQFVSQVEGSAEGHVMDCGPACCSMIILKDKGEFISVDDIYKVPGWFAPSTDIGTSANQLNLLLNVKKVNSEPFYSLRTLKQIKDYIDQNSPIITCIKNEGYKLFKEKGLALYPIKSGDHWLIVTGYTDTHIITMDPYRPAYKGGRMVVPNDMFVNSLRGDCVVCKISAVGTKVLESESNATVKDLDGLTISGVVTKVPESKSNATVIDNLNIRALPTKNSTDIGDLVHEQKIQLVEPIVPIKGTDGLDWVELVIPQAGVHLNIDSPTAFVAKKYLDIPVTPPTVTPPITPPTTDEVKDARLKEIINKMRAYLDQLEGEL